MWGREKGFVGELLSIAFQYELKLFKFNHLLKLRYRLNIGNSKIQLLNKNILLHIIIISIIK